MQPSHLTKRVRGAACPLVVSLLGACGGGGRWERTERWLASVSTIRASAFSAEQQLGYRPLGRERTRHSRTGNTNLTHIETILRTCSGATLMLLALAAAAAIRAHRRRGCRGRAATRRPWAGRRDRYGALPIPSSTAARRIPGAATHDRCATGRPRESQAAARGIERRDAASRCGSRGFG